MALPVMATYGGQQVKAARTRNMPRTGQTVGSSTINNNEEGYTRNVSDAELVDTNLRRYMDKSNPYIQGARGRVVQAANSRGLANSSLAAAGGEAAAIDAAGQFAMADAQAAQRAASESLQSLGSQRIADEGNQTSVFNTTYSSDTQANIANQDRTSREREAGLDRDFSRETDTRRRGYDVEDRDYGTERMREQRGWEVDDRNYNERQQARRNREGTAVATLQTIFNNPEYLRDPAGAAGMVQFYQDLWDELFPYDNEAAP